MRSEAISFTHSFGVASVQPSAEAGKDSRRAKVPWSQPRSLLEFAERLPPVPLPDVNPSQIHEGELPRFVAFGLFSLFEPRDQLVQLVLLHQVDADVVVRIAELSIDLDRAQAFLGGLLQAALEAHGPTQEGMCLGRRIQLDGVPVELDRAIQLSPYVAAVGLPPEIRRLPQRLLVFHCSDPLVTRPVRTRLLLRARGKNAIILYVFYLVYNL